MGKKLRLEVKPKKQKWHLICPPKEEADGDILKGAHTEIFGNSRITIDGCLGVYEYKDTYLKLRLVKGSVTICGSGFNIIYFENRLISVKGKISSLEFV